MYASGITYTGVASVSPGAGTLVAANDGLSVSTISPNTVVLGQNIGQAGDPAIFLSAREIPMAGNFLNLRGGSLVLSDVANPGTGSLLDIEQTLNDAITPAIENLIATITNVKAGFVPLKYAFTDGGSANFQAIINISIGGFGLYQLKKNGSASFGDPVNGNNFATITNGQAVAPLSTLLNSVFGAQQDFQATGGVGGQMADFLSNATIQDTGGATEYIGFGWVGLIERDPTVTGNTRGFLFRPSFITGIGTGKLIAFENSVGDVYLNSTAGARIGRTGIHGITTPTAWLHLGAGAAAASSAPVKFTTGVNQTVAEAGTFEFNGTNFFATRVAGTRETNLTGTSGAAAPGLTATPVFTSFYGGNTNALGDPNSWASVNINGTTFKIPLFT